MVKLPSGACGIDVVEIASEVSGLTSGLICTIKTQHQLKPQFNNDCV